MNIKKITLITILLFAVLTIGAVSAQDDVASDNVTVSDDADIIAEDDDYYIEVNTGKISIEKDEEGDFVEDDDVASIYLPSTTKSGSFQIHNGNDIVAKVDVKKSDDDHWDFEYDDGVAEGIIYLSDFNLNKVNNGDLLHFKFINANGVEDESYTQACTVTLTETTMRFTNVNGTGLTDEDVDIKVSKIDPNKTDENFTYVSVAKKAGYLIITIETDDDDEYEIFNENLNTTERQAVIREIEGRQFYSFGVSLNDINNYIAQNIPGANSLNDLIKNGYIASDDTVYIGLYETADWEEDDIYYRDLTLMIRDDGSIQLIDEDYVDVTYTDPLQFTMNEGWMENVIITYEISKEINGRIVIYINNDTVPAFKINFSEIDDDPDDDFKYLEVTIGDLRITQKGTYEIRDRVYDENNDPLFSYEDDDYEPLVLIEPQTVSENNVTIDFYPFPFSVADNITVIKINATAEEGDVVLVYVDESEVPLKFNLADCEVDENENYIISSFDLNLGVGVHNLKISCKGVNGTFTVNITTDLVIDIQDEDEPVYTTFNDTFVIIDLEDGEIFGTDGLVNLTIKDNDGNIITLQKELLELKYDDTIKAHVIRTSDVNVALNGKYLVAVRYFDGSKGIVEEEGNVTFKAFEAADYGVSVKDNYDNLTESLITFADIPLDEEKIYIEIDGNKTEIDPDSDLEWDPVNSVYYLPSDKLGELADGAHSVKVYIDTDAGEFVLANVDVTVDLIENIGLELTIAVDNIEEGQVAYVNITTNASFTGTVLVQVAGRNCTVEVVNGQGSTPINGLAADTYTATAIFKSDAIFADSTKTTTFNVTAKADNPDSNSTEVNGTASGNSTAPGNNTTPGTGGTSTDKTSDSSKTSAKKTKVKLTFKKPKVKRSAKKLVLKATLKINGKAKKGLKVIFKFKGKKYTGKTNKKGVAKVTIKKKVLKKLKKGKKIKVQASYGKTVKKYTVKVKK